MQASSHEQLTTPEQASAEVCVGDLLETARKELRRHHESARLDAEVLLAHVLDVTRARLHAWPDESVTPSQVACYQDLIARRSAGEPVAYLTGQREFWSLSLEVSPKTLIPRPETERLVELALERIAEGCRWRIADLGTGCGAVALAIASERRDCQVWATDVSQPALDVAERNAARLALDHVEFRLGDWCRALANERFMLIVSNPPYVPDGDHHLERGDVAFEPRQALAAGGDGLDAIRRIAGETPGHLHPGGTLVLEHGYDQLDAVREILDREGFTDVRGYRDLSGNDRAVAGVWPGR